MKNTEIVLFVLAAGLAVGCGPATETEAQTIDEGRSIQLGTTTQALSFYKQVRTCWAYGYAEAVCEVYCPTGWMATGGGCSANNEWWRVVESVPLSNEGWRCNGHEDHGSKYYNYGVTGYVVCLNITP